METNMPIGDKPTEKYGDIPINWRIYSIQELIDKKYLVGHLDGNHGELYPSSDEFTEVGIPYIGANDFSNGYIDYKYCKYLPQERARIFKKGIAKNGDVLFAHNATVGPVALIKTKFEYVILSTTATYFRCNQEKLLNIFLLYALQAPFFVSQYQSVMAQSTRNQVPITVQRKFSLLLPPLPEQEAIAQSLSDVDTLITALDQVITKKHNIKQGTMQQLLTGKKRLPGFSGEWEVKTFKDVSFVNQGLQIAIEKRLKQPIQNSKQYITIQFLNNAKDIEYIHDYSPSVCCNEEDVLMTRTGNTGIIVSGVNGVFHNNFFKINFDRKIIDKKYLIGYLNLDKTQKIILAKAGTSTIPDLNHNDFYSITIPIPSLSEQKAIAQVLSDMDAEIEALEKKRDKYKAIKQGMMQELLTGKTRIIDN